MSNLTICLILLAANALSAVAYLLFALFFRKDGRPILHWMRFFCLLACPVAAPLFFAGSFLAYRFLFRIEGGRKSVDFDKHAGKSVSVPDMDTQMNVVPLEEALTVSDKADLRRLLLNVLKDGAESTIGAVSLVLASQDSEAAHYSASAIADSLSGFQSRVGELEAAVAERPDEPKAYAALIDYMLWYLRNGLLIDRELHLYAEKAADYCARLIDLSPAGLSPVFLQDLTTLFVDTNDLEAAGKWADMAWRLYPDTLEAFTARLHVLYARGDAAGFAECLGELKKSKVVINKQLLDLIRALQ